MGIQWEILGKGADTKADGEDSQNGLHQGAAGPIQGPLDGQSQETADIAKGPADEEPDEL